MVPRHNFTDFDRGPVLLCCGFCHSARMSVSVPPALLAARRRADFPALKKTVHGKPLCYLDNASTGQKPQVVLDRLLSAYVDECGNVHRGVHLLSQQATRDFESVRDKVRRFLSAPSDSHVVFARGTTEAINLLAQTHGFATVQPGDEVIVTQLEHHSNFVPWQRLCEQKQAKLVVAPITTSGTLDMSALSSLISPRTRILACSHASNVNGAIVDVKAVCALAKQVSAITVVDGAQAVPHLPVDVSELGCDFYCFSAHKLYAPFGVGVLWGKKDAMAALSPWQTGGGMVQSVTAEHTEFQPVPFRLEAGTPAVAEVIALGTAIDYLAEIGMSQLAEYESFLMLHMVQKLSQIPGLSALLPDGPTVPVLSFQLSGIHPHDVGTALDLEGIAVRAGLHCAEPLFAALGIRGSVRASLSFYNTVEEIDHLAAALIRTTELFR